MIRTLNIVLAISAVMALVGVYGLKYSVEGTAATKKELESTIERQQADLSLLKADWSYLNQPAHVAPIVNRHLDALGLAPIKQAQFGALASLPMRPPAPDTNALNALFQSLESGVDPAAKTLAPEQ
ncbi:MAG TPA: hypothetical protein VGO70_04315 [Arsenicitalea sp.]|jgi:hypothetical protein|nr:hypothetical protein [Arsenicitalea sp.]